MNFFGHAVVAGWTGAEPGAVLGSMLPDFESMVHVRLVRVHDGEVQNGIDFHHRTDDAFHRVPTFSSLCAQALRDLTHGGVRRGTARAVAHLGSEIFLDGWLAQNERNVNNYLSAFYPELAIHLEWEDRGHAFSKLHARLRTWGAPHEYREPSFVLQRLSDALRTRPRLAVLEEQAGDVADFLPVLQREVERRAPELLKELRDALGLEY